MNITEVMSNLSLFLQIVTIAISLTVLKYTMDGREIKNLEDSLEKFYYPLRESMKTNPCSITKEMTTHRDLAEEDTIEKLQALINLIRVEERALEKLEKFNYAEFVKFKNRKLPRISEEKCCDFLRHLSTKIEQKEKRLSDLRKSKIKHFLKAKFNSLQRKLIEK
jgi:hypothetical protein